MSVDVKKKLKKSFNRNFLARDFEALRTELIEHARTYYPEKIQDFSEASVGGMLVDMAAMVGDTMSFYLDHQFRELDPMKAVEPVNIRMHLKNAGVQIYGATPASTELTFSFDVNSQKVSGGYRPDINNLPVILQGTEVTSTSGIVFTTTEDLDFAELDVSGNLVCEYFIKTTNAAGNPAQYNVSAKVMASSGKQATDTFSISNTHVPFREITLSNPNVSTIISVKDSDANIYYEVSSLSQDTVFTAVKNIQSDAPMVPSNLEITPAPRRFTKTHNPTTKFTTLKFGSGDSETLDDDVLPDPSDLSLDLYGKKDFPRFSIDPNSLLQTQTLGMSPRNTTLTVSYRHGGGLNHNVTSKSVTEISSLLLEFRQTANPSGALSVKQSLGVTNASAAVGGSEAPTLETLRQLIPTARQSQARVVTREDLLARLYTMPAQFGRVYRASIAPNPVNPLSALLYITSLDRDGNMTVAPDTLKKNLSKYLNEFRLISDAIDILDTQVINYGVKYSVIVTQDSNKIQVIQNINNRIADALQKKYFQIDQPLVIDDITNTIINTDSVISMTELKVYPIVNKVEDRQYSSSTFPFGKNTKNGIIFGPQGSIFELKFPAHDIIGTAE